MADKNISNKETHAPWQREFIQNIDVFVKSKVSKDKAAELLKTYIELSGKTPVPEVMKTFQDEKYLEEVGVYTERDEQIRDFMVEFLRPLLRKFTIEGRENIRTIVSLLGKYPVTLVANHLSHFDTAALYVLLYLEGGDARKLL